MIRRCTSSDIKRIVELEQYFSSPLSEDFITQEIESNPLSHYLCFEENGVVKGYIGLWLTDIGSIINLVVDELYRENKIASRLIEASIETFNNNGINQISLDVRVSNNKAISLYKKYNFKEVLIRKKYYSNNEDAIVMIRSNV